MMDEDYEVLDLARILIGDLPWVWQRVIQRRTRMCLFYACKDIY